MTTVQSTGASSDAYAAINAKGKSTATTTTVEDSQDRFLKLLVTQLKNQDPLNPMDNAQMTSQLAQMSTVSGIEKLNTTLNTLVDNLGSSQSMQAADLIGKSVLVPGSQLALKSGSAFAGIKLASAADQVTLKVMDASGAVIKTEKLGAQKAGVIDIAWDGTTDSGVNASDGNYTFTVEATQGSTPVTVDALQLGTVSALIRSSSGFLLDLGALGQVDFKNVQQII